MSSVCMQVGRDSNGNVVIGNATIIATNVAAANGVVHVIDRFPLDNAAFNTTMVAALEAAGDFGPFDEAKVTSPASFLLLQQLGWGLGPLWGPWMCLFSLPNSDMRSSVLVQGNEGWRCSFDVSSVHQKGGDSLLHWTSMLLCMHAQGRIAVCSLVHPLCHAFA